MKKNISIWLVIIIILGGGFYYLYNGGFGYQPSKSDIMQFKDIMSKKALLFSYLMEDQWSSNQPFIVRKGSGSFCANSGKIPKTTSYSEDFIENVRGKFHYTFCGKYYIVSESSSSFGSRSFGIFYGGSFWNLICRGKDNQCHFVKAIHKNDPQLCQKIVNSDFRKRCTTIVALQTDNAANCNLSDNEGDIKYCLGKFVDKKVYDKTLTENFCKENPLIQGECYSWLGISSKNASYCDKSNGDWNKEICIRTLLVQYKDELTNLSKTSCEAIRNDVNLKGFCYELLKDPNLDFKMYRDKKYPK